MKIMKKVYSILFLLILCIALIPGCGSREEEQAAAITINAVVEKIQWADSLFWYVSSHIEFKGSEVVHTITNESENKWVGQPFAFWQKTRMVSKNSEHVFEIYHAETEEGFNTYTRTHPDMSDANVKNKCKEFQEE